MAITAEIIEIQNWGHIDVDPELPLVLAIPELSHDKQTRQRAAQFIGAVALNETIQSIPELSVDKPIESLFEAIKAASEGDIEARKLIETNVRTDVIERTTKAGHVMKVDLIVDQEGKVKQHGQAMDSVQANSLRFASNMWQMRERTEAETRNAFRIEKAYNAGLLKDYSLVVFSRAADNMPAEQMKKAGFFTDTMSCAIQVTTASEQGLTTESAFVAGVKEPGGERHDEATIVALGEALKVDFSGKTAAETLDFPILIRNDMIPNGATDLVKLWDNCAGGTFYGENRPQHDYLEYRELCRTREQTYEPKVQQITEALIAEAGHITTPLMATDRLGKLSEKYMVEKAVEDDTINPKVFGDEAAGHIEQARIYRDQGNLELALHETFIAKQTAKSFSCPTGGRDPSAEGSSSETAKNESDLGDCEYISKECPLCHAKNVKTLVTKTRITCGTCKGYVAKNPEPVLALAA